MRKLCTHVSQLTAYKSNVQNPTHCDTKVTSEKLLLSN